MNERLLIIGGILFYLYTVTCIFFTVRIASMKGRRRRWGWLAFFFGLIGLIAVCFLPNAAGVTGETNPIRALFRRITGAARAAAVVVAAALIVALVGTALAGRISESMENRAHARELTAGTTGGTVSPGAINGAVTTVSCGTGCNLAVTESGALYGWGAITLLAPNEEGALYNGALKAELVGGLCCVLAKDHTLYAKGDNSRARIAGSAANTVGDFVAVEKDVKDFALGEAVCAILKQSGNLYVVGTNYYGQLGRDQWKVTNTENKLAEKVRKVRVSARTLCYLTENGSVYAVGSNAYGQLGTGNKDKAAKPVKIGEGCKDFALGADFILLLKKDGTVWSAGSNAAGQLGHEPENPLVMEQIPLLEGITAVYAGGSSAFAQKDAALYAWGANSFGQLGTGNTAFTAEPVRVAENAAALDTNGACTLLITTDGALLAAGDTRNSRLGNAAGTGFHEPAAVRR